MMEGKRSVFSADEKIILKELVNKNKDTIECKGTDCISISHKKKAWLSLMNEFIGMSQASHRTVEQLRKWWENMKSRRKKELIEEKKERLAAGGGVPSCTENNEPVLDDVLQTVDIELRDVIDSDRPPQLITNQPEIGEASGTTTAEANMTPYTKKSVSKTFISRGLAIERELESRLTRNEALQI